MSEIVSTLEPALRTAGPLSAEILPGLLRDIHVGHRSGILRFARGDEQASVSFRDGNVVFGGANIAECLMGVTFVRHGLVQQDQLDRALEASARTGRRLGDELIALGFVDQAALDDGLALHVREILRCVFAWTDGSYEFEELPPERIRTDRPLRLSTGEVILDAVWSIPDDAVLRHALGDLDRVLVRTSDPSLALQQVQLTPADGFLMSRVDGTLTAREVLEIVDTGPEAARSLFGLLCIGMLAFAAERPNATGAGDGTARRAPAAPQQPPAPVAPQPPSASTEDRARFRSRDAHVVLGVPRSATPAEVKAAYFKLVRAYHPDVQHAPDRAGERGEIEAIFTRINEAYRALSTAPAPPAPRPEPAPRPAVGKTAPRTDPPEAVASPKPAPTPAPGGSRIEEALHAADEQLAAGEPWKALSLVQDVLSDANGALRQRAHHLIARVYLRVPDRLHEAEAQLRTAVSEDGHDAEAFFLLGSVYEASGDPARARLMFRRALALDPAHAGARARAGTAQPEAPSRRGLLARLTGRS